MTRSDASSPFLTPCHFGIPIFCCFWCSNFFPWIFRYFVLGCFEEIQSLPCEAYFWIHASKEWARLFFSAKERNCRGVLKIKKFLRRKFMLGVSIKIVFVFFLTHRYIFWKSYELSWLNICLFFSVWYMLGNNFLNIET